MSTPAPHPSASEEPELTKPKRKKWPWIVAVVGAVVVIAAVAGGTGGSKENTTPAQPTGAPAGNEVAAPTQSQQAPPQGQAAKPAQHTVVYQVTGTGKATSITYTTDGMTSTNQEADVKLPWEKTITLPGDQALQMVSIMAQGGGKGTVKATVEVDGKLFKEANAQGYGVAMANGSIGTMG